MGFADRQLTCMECGAEFLFTAGEQEFYKFKGFENDPKQCKQCRWSRSGHAGKRRVDTAVKCGECGVDTTVPFLPTGNRPVLCRACYQAKRDKEAISGSSQASNAKPDHGISTGPKHS